MAPKSRRMTKLELRDNEDMVAKQRDQDTDALIDKALFESEQHKDLPLREYYQATGKRFWCLSPRALSVIKLHKMDGGTCDIEASDQVFKTIADVLLLK